MIADESNPGLEKHLLFGLASLNKFHCNICKNDFCQDTEIINLILLGEKDLDYLFNEIEFIPITIIETFLDLLNHLFHDDEGTVIHPII